MPPFARCMVLDESFQFSKTRASHIKLQQTVIAFLEKLRAEDIEYISMLKHRLKEKHSFIFKMY